MKQKQIDFIKLLKGYKTGWVAISSSFDRVVVSGRTLNETMKKVQKEDKQVFYFPVEKSYSNFIGFLH